MRMRLWSGVVGVGLALLAVAGAAQNPPAAGGGMGQMGMAQNCPITLSGVDVAARDTDKGIELTFTAKPENVAELQRRVQRMANMQQMMAGAPQMQNQNHMLPGEVKYEALTDGARLTLTPKDPARLAEFRTQVRARVEEMMKGNCSMMETMMGGMMGMSGGMMKQPAGTK